MHFPVISSVLGPSVLFKTLIKDYQFKLFFYNEKEIEFSNP